MSRYPSNVVSCTLHSNPPGSYDYDVHLTCQETEAESNEVVFLSSCSWCSGGMRM